MVVATSDVSHSVITISATRDTDMEPPVTTSRQRTIAIGSIAPKWSDCYFFVIEEMTPRPTATGQRIGGNNDVIASKVPLPEGQSGPQTNVWFAGPTSRVAIYKPDGISIGSVVSAGLTAVKNTPHDMCAMQLTASS